MHWTRCVGWAAAAATVGIGAITPAMHSALVSIRGRRRQTVEKALTQPPVRSSTDTVVAQTTVVTDRDTGFKFSAYSGRYDLSPSTIQFRVAVPSNAGSGQAYDAVVQIIAPHEIGWAGLAWGGTMTYNPLTVAYPNGQSVVVSSRWATQHAAPGMYPGASYQILRKGTHVNRTHWQVTAKCSGCTAFRGEGGATSYLRPQSSNRLAFALARQGPSPPITNTSTIMYHDVHQYWSHDFGSGGNTNFAALLQQNLG